MKLIKKLLIIFFLLILLTYTTAITVIPSNIILLKGESLNLNLIFGINTKKISKTVLQTSTTSTDIQTEVLQVSLFNMIPVKEVTVNTIPETEVVPLGNTIGLKLFINGVLVIGMSDINGKKPYENSGIQEGDVIVEVNKKEITSTEELVKCVNSSQGKIVEIIYIRNGEEFLTSIEPTKNTNNEYKLGLWVRDGAAGIGTVSYYEPKTGGFGALGHGIVDSDTDKLLEISSGELVTTTITSITKGEQGEPRRNKRYN